LYLNRPLLAACSLLLTSSIYIGCAAPHSAQFRAMTDELYEVLKPEIDRAAITVERGRLDRAQVDETLSGSVRPSTSSDLLVRKRENSESAMASPSPSPITPRSSHGSIDYLRIKVSDRVLFESGDEQLTAEGRAVLERIATVLTRATNVDILVEGHTDSLPISARLRARFASNMDLAKARAVNTTQTLTEGGVSEQLLLMRWYGETRPVASNATEDGRGKNRRVEVSVIAR
jgi:outer membrane protein OmpA-like peptidoglycan-associated protein